MSAAEAARVGTGLAFVVMPLVFVRVRDHPDLLRPRVLRPEQLIDRARGRRLLHAGPRPGHPQHGVDDRRCGTSRACRDGWLWLLWGIVLIPIGFAVLAIAALVSGATSPWEAILLLMGVLLIGFPDGAEIVNLGVATMAAGLVPFGLTMMVQ